MGLVAKAGRFLKNRIYGKTNEKRSREASAIHKGK